MPRKGENIYKRNDGRWEGRYAVETSRNNSKKYLSVYGKTYREVKEKLIRSKAVSMPKPSKIMFREAAERWLSHAKTRVKESTFANYTYLLNKHILPFFGNVSLDKFDAATANRFIDEKLTNGRLKQNKGISKKYMKDILSVVKSVVRFAEDEYHIPNQIERVKSPAVDKPDYAVMTDDEIKTLSDCVSSDCTSENTAVLLTLYTGMRIGEVCGLKWEDYDAENKTVSIRRTVQRVSDNDGHTKLIEGTPKTKSSERVIPLPENVCAALNALPQNNAYIIGNEPRIIRKHFKEILRDCGLKPMRYHQLRHNFASWALRRNFDIKALSEILGHSNTAMTLNRYAHTNMETKREYMGRLIA